MSDHSMTPPVGVCQVPPVDPLPDDDYMSSRGLSDETIAQLRAIDPADFALAEAEAENSRYDELTDNLIEELKKEKRQRDREPRTQRALRKRILNLAEWQVVKRGQIHYVEWHDICFLANKESIFETKEHFSVLEKARQELLAEAQHEGDRKKANKMYLVEGRAQMAVSLLAFVLGKVEFSLVLKVLEQGLRLTESVSGKYIDFAELEKAWAEGKKKQAKWVEKQNAIKASEQARKDAIYEQSALDAMGAGR